jgi:anaerobic carbon-monoxide dehydrogenase iron sulfur subunit
MVRYEHCLGCKSCELACAVAHSTSKTLNEVVLNMEKPSKRVFVESNGLQHFPIQCRQCQDQPCVQACISGAMQVDPITGLIQIDTSHCVGCWMCVMTCPYGAIIQTPAQKAAKCDLCLEQDYDPACVKACPTKAIEYVDVNAFAQSGRIHYLTWFIHSKEG